MSNFQHLIELLKSDNPNKRYDACEELRVSRQPLPQEAIDVLKSVTNDSNPDVADAAQRALALHTQVSNDPELGQEQDKSSAITISPTNKGIDFAGGFFGCLIIWNSLGYIAYWYIGVALLLEFIGLILPFAFNKKWIGFGVVSYIITNAIVLSVLSGEFSLYGLIIPFGAMFFLQ